MLPIAAWSHSDKIVSPSRLYLLSSFHYSIQHCVALNEACFPTLATKVSSNSSRVNPFMTSLQIITIKSRLGSSVAASTKTYGRCRKGSGVA